MKKKTSNRAIAAMSSWRWRHCGTAHARRVSSAWVTTDKRGKLTNVAYQQMWQINKPGILTNVAYWQIWHIDKHRDNLVAINDMRPGQWQTQTRTNTNADNLDGKIWDLANGKGNVDENGNKDFVRDPRQAGKAFAHSNNLMGWILFSRRIWTR